MEVNFASSFLTSLKKLIRRETWWYQTYNFLRRDIWHFLGNIWRFRKGLFHQYWWDWRGILYFMQDSLTYMSDNIAERGYEVEKSRMKKVAAMRRAVVIIENVGEDRYLEMAERELGEIHHHTWEFESVPDHPGSSRLIDNEIPEEKEHNSQVYARSCELEEQEWKELWAIFKGQDVSEYDRKTQDWDKFYDGTGLKGWWD